MLVGSFVISSRRNKSLLGNTHALSDSSPTMLRIPCMPSSRHFIIRMSMRQKSNTMAKWIASSSPLAVPQVNLSLLANQSTLSLVMLVLMLVGDATQLLRIDSFPRPKVLVTRSSMPMSTTRHRFVHAVIVSANPRGCESSIVNNVTCIFIEILWQPRICAVLVNLVFAVCIVHSAYNAQAKSCAMSMRFQVIVSVLFRHCITSRLYSN